MENLHKIEEAFLTESPTLMRVAFASHSHPCRGYIALIHEFILFLVRLGA